MANRPRFLSIRSGLVIIHRARAGDRQSAVFIQRPCEVSAALTGEIFTVGQVKLCLSLLDLFDLNHFDHGHFRLFDLSHFRLFDLGHFGLFDLSHFDLFDLSLHGFNDRDRFGFVHGELYLAVSAAAVKSIGSDGRCTDADSRDKSVLIDRKDGLVRA